MKKGFLAQLALLAITASLTFSCQGNNKNSNYQNKNSDESTAALTTPAVQTIKYNAPENEGTSGCVGRPGTAMSEKEHKMIRMPTDKTPRVNGQPIPQPAPGQQRPTSALIEEEPAMQMIEEDSVVAEIEVFAPEDSLI